MSITQKLIGLLWSKPDNPIEESMSESDLLNLLISRCSAEIDKLDSLGLMQTPSSDLWTDKFEGAPEEYRFIAIKTEGETYRIALLRPWTGEIKYVKDKESMEAWSEETVKKDHPAFHFHFSLYSLAHAMESKLGLIPLMEQESLRKGAAIRGS